MSEMLPLGTVIKKKNENHELMIYGYFPTNVETKETKDYLCCLFPEGINEKCWHVNNNEIEKTCFIGYQTPYYGRVRKAIKEINDTEELTEEKVKEILKEIKGDEENVV